VIPKGVDFDNLHFKSTDGIDRKTVESSEDSIQIVEEYFVDP